MVTPTRSTRTTLFWMMPSILLWTKWLKTRTRTNPKRSLKVSKTSLDPKCTRTYSRLCWTTIGNYSDLKTNSKCLSKRPNKEASPSPKFSHPRKRSCMKRLKRWQTGTLGSCSPTSPSVNWARTRMRRLTVLCSINPRSFQTRSLIGISMKRSWSFQPKCFRPLSIRLTFLSWRRRSTDFLDRMLSTFPQEFSSMRPGWKSTLNWRSQTQRRPRPI